MKKFIFIMPLMAVSLLASCGQPKQATQHFVTFESNGGSHIDTQRVDDGGVATDPGKSTRPGYDFKGWYTSNPNPTPIEEDKYDFTSKVTSDITLYAGYISSDINHYDFSFNGTGCTVLNDPQYQEIDIEEGSSRKFTIVPSEGYKLPLAVTITEGSGCATYDKETITISNMNSNVVVTASATPIEKITYTITFHDGGDTEPKIENIEPGSIIPATDVPEVPTKEGFTPIGWCTDQAGTKVFDFVNVEIYQDYDLYPGYSPIVKHSINFYKEKDDTQTYAAITDIGDGALVDQTKLPADPTKEGYNFGGWCTDKAGTKVFDFTTVKIYQDYDLYAGYTPIPVPDTYTITFNPNGGTLDEGAKSSIDGIVTGTNFYEIEGIENQKATHSDKGHYSFVGWGLSPNTPDKISDTYEITNSFTAYAIYHPESAASIKLTDDSRYCSLHYGDLSYDIGVPFYVPAGVDVILTIEFKEGYLPVFQDNLSFNLAGTSTGTFDSVKKEITVNLDANSENSIKAVTTLPKAKLDDYSWSEISQISKMGLASTYFKVYDPNDKPELSIKKLQLKHQSGDIYQTVKIIGINEDYTELPLDGSDPNPEKVIGITFEFADILSDANGYSLATYWNDVAEPAGSNHDYMDSSVRAALNGTFDDPTQGSTKEINWFQYFGTEHDEDTNKHFTTDTKYVGKSVLDMLPDELTEEGILRAPAKYINIYNSQSSKWEEKTVKDPLFLLSPREMYDLNYFDIDAPHAVPYSYYDGKTVFNFKTKHQIKGKNGARTNYLIADLEGKYISMKKYSYAGLNDNYEDYMGGYSWLRSPNTTGYNSACCLDAGGSVSATMCVYENALGVAPAFCI